METISSRTHHVAESELSRHHARRSPDARKRCPAPILVILMALALTTVSSAAPQTAPRAVSAYVVSETAPSPVESTLTALAVDLGWSSTRTALPDLPGQTQQVSPHGDPADRLTVSVSVVDMAAERTLLSVLEAQGLSSGLWHGREAIIAHPGDPAARGRGIIAWRCGPYVLAAEDMDGQGRETQTAEALYRAAETCSLCGIGASVVIAVRTADATPLTSRTEITELARASQVFYDHNAYGRVDLALSDAGGTPLSTSATIAGDWLTIAPSLDAFAEPAEIADAAIRAALASQSLRQAVYAERIIVILAGDGSQHGTGQRWFAARTGWWPREHYVTAPHVGGQVRVYVPNIVLMLESDSLGTWVHELGHTLHAQTPDSGTARLTDRYQERGREPYDDLGSWDLMARGSHWGSPRGSRPTHMSSYTKVEANWLRPVSVGLGEADESQDSYTLEAVENQAMGAAVLRLADPRSPDGQDYYLIEARDAETPFGAPESGVLIEHVRLVDGVRQVLPLVPEVSGAARWGQSGTVRPTLHSAADPSGAHAYTLPGGLRVRLLTETFRPYRATIRIERGA